MLLVVQKPIGKIAAKKNAYKMEVFVTAVDLNTLTFVLGTPIVYTITIRNDGTTNASVTGAMFVQPASSPTLPVIVGSTNFTIPPLSTYDVIANYTAVDDDVAKKHISETFQFSVSGVADPIITTMPTIALAGTEAPGPLKEITRVVELDFDPHGEKKQHFRACIKNQCYAEIGLPRSGSFTPTVTTTLPSPSVAVGLPNYYRLVGTVVSLTGGVSANLIAVNPMIGEYTVTLTLPDILPDIRIPVAGSVLLELSPPLAGSVAVGAVTGSVRTITLTFTFIGVSSITGTMNINYVLSYASSSGVGSSCPGVITPDGYCCYRRTEGGLYCEPLLAVGAGAVICRGCPRR